MNRYVGLRFFNGTKSEIELDYNSTNETYSGSINLDEVSTGLYETATLFILEDIFNQYGSPAMCKPIGSNATSQFKFQFDSEKNASADINLFTASLAADNQMYVKKETSQLVNVQSNSIVVSTASDGIHTVGSGYSTEAMQVTIGLHSDIESSHYRYLRIYDTVDNHLVATIYVYGEAVGEDERLSVLLSNFGTSVTVSDQFLFKDHDINEVGGDWKLINRKRRELLLELSNIKPFVGTYKALLNAIKFFGYNNLTLKEYWLMIDDRSTMFGKLKAVEVPNTAAGFTLKKREVGLPSASFKKTSRFGLFYKLNEPTGKFDNFDVPIVKEVFDFTPEEVLIKLYGLKNKLQKEYLPLQAKIIDIIGEGDFFAQYNTNIWNNQNPITTIVSGIDPSIKIHQNKIYVEDLKKVSTLFEGGLQDFSRLNAADIATLYTATSTFYEDYYDINRNTFNSNNTDERIGAPIQLECTTFLDTWDDAKFTWFDAETFITWANWWEQNIYELRWYITGPRDYSQTLIGSIDKYRKIALALPYSGLYSIKFEQVDLFNNVMVVRMEDAIDVQLKAIEISGVFRWKDTQEYLWGQANYNWKKAGGIWNFPQQNKDIVDKEIATLYPTLDRSNYLHGIENGVNFSMVKEYKDVSSPSGYSETTGPYFWKNLKNHKWNDGKHTWWESTHVGADHMASFTIQSASINSDLEISYFNLSNVTTTTVFENINHDLTNPFVLQPWSDVADELNASTNAITSKFTFNPIFEDTNNDGTVDKCVGILAAGKNYSITYNFSNVAIVNGVGVIINESTYESHNPTYNDVRVIAEHTEIELLTHMTYVAEASKIPGKFSYSWKLHNNSKDIDDIYYNNKWLTYLFEHKGDYTIELEVRDVNGNTKKSSKNALTIK
jgi:hypothetical protein